VKPVALIPSSVLENVSQILINRESLSHYVPDIELLGNCDEIIRILCRQLGEPPFDTCIGQMEDENDDRPPTVFDAASFRQMIDEPEAKRYPFSLFSSILE
jgi:hypothetical protein